MRTIRIGTRDSTLALWQATQVQKQLEKLNFQTELVPLKATGDVLLDKPLYELGITGIFTRHLDVAMLQGDIDIAVHSMKDVPTLLPKGIVQAGVLARANSADILVFKEDTTFLEQGPATIATSSLRRKAQWLNRYPEHNVVDLRGNVQTRLAKLANNSWQGAIFAAAGLERIQLRPEKSLDLDWMIPAPAQGVIMITAREDDAFILQACQKINHEPTALCAQLERDFLNRLEGGCSAPIGALATILETNIVDFQGVLLSEDGQQKISVHRQMPLPHCAHLGKDCALAILSQGGEKLLNKQSLFPKIPILSSKTLTPAQRALLPDEIQLLEQDFIHISAQAKISAQASNMALFTSPHAVNAVDFSTLTCEKIYCVGEQTALAIQAKSAFSPIWAKDAKELAEVLLQQEKPQRVNYFCGNLHLTTLPEKLRAKGFLVEEIECYTTSLLYPKITQDFHAVLFFSPSAVESFARHNPCEKIAFCLGESTAKQARLYFAQVFVAPTPNTTSLLQTVSQFFMKQL